MPNELHDIRLDAVVTERCAYAPILAEFWRRFERGERGVALTSAFAMYVTICKKDGEHTAILYSAAPSVHRQRSTTFDILESNLPRVGR